MAWKPLKYGKDYSWKTGNTKPAVTDGVTEGSIGYEVDESKPAGEQVSIYKFLQGDWRLL